MSSSDDSDDVALMWWHRRRRRKRRKYWVHPVFTSLVDHGANICAKELRRHPAHFHNCYRMSPNTFHILLNLIEPLIIKHDTNCRESISPTERLLITLRYLATGCTFMAFSYIFMRGNNTIGIIVKECTTAIWHSLQPLYMPVPTEKKWRSIAKRYYELWDLPNCIGSIDGKHCRINKFARTASPHYNCKGFFSIVLMACEDTDGIFTTIDVGEAGRNSDGAVFRSSALGKLLDKEKLLIPTPSLLPNDQNEFPFYFVADEAFPLKRNLMRPYPQRTLDNEKRECNYRFSRGRKSIECAFGMLVSKFQLFQRPILCSEQTAISVIKAACVLHNFIRITEGKFFIPQVTKEDDCTTTSQVPINNNNMQANNTTAYELRDYLKAYFQKPENKLPWQGLYTI